MSIVTELRKYKLFDIAMFDVIATFIGAFILWKYSNKTSINELLIIFILFLILGVIVHKVFKIPTMGNYYLGLNTKEEVLKAREE